MATHYFDSFRKGSISTADLEALPSTRSLSMIDISTEMPLRKAGRCVLPHFLDNKQPYGCILTRNLRLTLSLLTMAIRVSLSDMLAKVMVLKSELVGLEVGFLKVGLKIGR
jgi:hypothetical protein